MKKIFTLTALPLCALLAFGACANRTDTPSEPADPSSTQVSVQELTEAREHAGALKAELDEMNQLLQIEQTEKQALSDRVDELEDALAAALEGKEGSGKRRITTKMNRFSNARWLTARLLYTERAFPTDRFTANIWPTR